MRNLDEVLRRLKEHGMKLHLDKCSFFSGACGVPGSLHRCTGGAYVLQEGAGHSAGTTPTKCSGITLNVGFDQLLCQVHPKPSSCPTSTS